MSPTRTTRAKSTTSTQSSKKSLGETHGLLVFQEQLAMLAHKLGKDISLDEGNLLRKVLTKKGTGKDKVRDKIYKKFRSRLCRTRTHKEGRKLSGLTWNTSPAMASTYLTLYLTVRYPSSARGSVIIIRLSGWLRSWTRSQKIRRLELSTQPKSFGFEIEPPSINKSGRVWEIDDDGKTLIQPLAGIKGLGDSALDQIINNRPFNTIEEFLFNEGITYSKLNKKALDVLVRSKALDELMDDRFTGLRHFWSAVAVDRPRKEKNLEDNIELYAPEGDFTDEEKLEHFASLTGIFPIHEIMPQEIQDNLMGRGCPPISEYDPDLQLVWFIPREVKVKKTNSLNKVYVANLEYNEKWGFSTRSLRRTFRRLT